MKHFPDVRVLSPAIGAEIRGIDVARAMDDPTFERIHAAWLAHLVLLVRDQRLADEALVRFTSRFGELEEAPLFQGRRFVEEHPEVMIISNVSVEGREIGSLGNSEAFWHTDLNFVEQPPAASCLYAHEVPAGGWRYGFREHVSGVRNASGRPSLRESGPLHPPRRALQQRGLSARGARPRHLAPDRAHASGDRTQGAVPRTPREREHRRHMPVDESDALLDALWDHATGDAVTWHHRWRAGDLLIWDNRCTLHRRDSFDGSERRIMHRTQTRGTRPFEQQEP